MYKITHVISALIRQFLLPNPYINIIGDVVWADLFNIVIGGTILHYLSFILTGAGYKKEIDNPASGSLGYLISYIYLTVIITIIGKLISNIKVFLTTFIIIYFISLIIVNRIFNKNYNFWKEGEFYKCTQKIEWISL